MPRALDIAGMVCPNNVFLAPMAGYTNYPYRKLCEEFGAGLTFTEMVSAKGLHYGNEETNLLLYHGAPASEGDKSAPSPEGDRGVGILAPASCFPLEGEVPPQGAKGVSPHRPLAAQLFGSEPDILREACESEALADFGLIDLNMGCPMPKIVKNGEGNALMENPALAEKIIAECVKSGKRISVKFRTGVDEARKCTAEFAKRCEGAGACLVTVHGRTREKVYAGPPDYAEIAAAKAAVKIPVIANGGVWNEKDMQKMLDRTGADGVMVARAAMYDPRVFCALNGQERPPLLPYFLRLIEEERELYGERFALVFCRKMAAFWLKGTRGAAAGKRRLFAAETTEEVAALAVELFSEEGA